MADITSGTTPWPEATIKNYQWLDEYLRSRPGTEKEFQPAWQAFKYLLRGKMYAYIGVHDKTGRPLITVKLDPDFSVALRRQYADVVEGYYMNKMHWSTVYLDGEVSRDLLSDIASASYETLLLSLSKKTQREITGA